VPEDLRFDLSRHHGDYDAAGYYRLTDFELATGWVGGFDAPTPTPAVGGGLTPRQGFEASLLPALRRSPCVVAFSGGRDSTAVLAVATHVARREGLPDPVPATHDFIGHGEADESTEQELVIRHLGLQEWHRIRNVDAFDVLGERARAGLLRHGLLWPALAHCHAPLAELAAGGGSLVVGEGGDEVLGVHRMTAVNYVLKKRRLRSIELRMLSHSLAPRSLHERRYRRELGAAGMQPWLRSDISERFLREHARDHVRTPLRADAAIRRHARRRALTTGTANIRRILDADEVSFHMPFLDPLFLEPFARAAGLRGWISRTAMMRMLFADVVPDAICRRDAKAQFGGVAMGRPSRQFLADWDGEGIDPEVVDIGVFRAAAQEALPLFGIQMLLQSAWLAINHRSALPVAGQP
jgi:hypothetical protein